MHTETDSPHFALVAALAREGDILLTQLRITQSIACNGLEILIGTLAERNVLVAFSGLGKINAAGAIATILTRFDVSRVWMWGSAGLYPHAGANLTHLALASEEILGDEGVLTLSSWQPLDAIGIPLLETGHGPVYNRIPIDQVELERAQCLLGRWHPADFIPSINVGPFVTVSGVSGSLARARLLGKRFGALCENMEGGAAAQVCLSHGVPFFEIRGISNWAGDRNKRRWYLQESLNNCQKALLYLLDAWDET